MAKKYSNREIESYVHGRMTPEENERFEADMTQDNELSQEVDSFRAEAALYQMVQEEELLHQFDEWDKENEKKGSKKSSVWWKFGLGILVLLVGIAIWRLNSNPIPPSTLPNETDPLEETNQVISTEGEETEENATQQDSKEDTETKDLPPNTPIAGTIDYDQLAAEQYKNAPFNNQLRDLSSNDQDSSRYNRALALFEDQQYGVVLQMLTPLDSTRRQPFLYLRAHAYYQLQQFVEAKSDFAAFREFRFSNLKVDALWGEALTMMRQMPDTKDQLVPLLDSLRSTPGPYQNEADTLYQKLLLLE